jgi:hypothetical protein
MSKVSPTKKQHRSMRGKTVDMDLLRKRNELTPAVGNARVNARGDELGPGGQIVRKREDIVQEHYAQAGVVADSSGRTKTTKDNTVTKKTTETINTVAKKEETVLDAPLTAAEQEMLDEADAWVEDADGNFVPKGE